MMALLYNWGFLFRLVLLPDYHLKQITIYALGRIIGTSITKLFAVPFRTDPPHL